MDRKGNFCTITQMAVFLQAFAFGFPFRRKICTFKFSKEILVMAESWKYEILIWVTA